MRLILALFVLMPFQWANANQCQDLFTQKSVLYSISKNGKMSFLMGTFPLAMSSNEFPQFVRDAITRSPFFVNDFNPDQIPQDALFESPDGRRALPYIQFIEGSQRAALGSTESSRPLMEVELRGFARYKGRSPIYLEDVSAVLQSYFDGVNFDLLEWTFTKSNSVELSAIAVESLRAQKEAYLTGNVEEFRRLFEKSYSDLKTERLLATAVRERNEKWLPRLQELHRKGGFFFAIETGHLVGESGLIELLDGSGFTVRRVKDATGLKLRREDFPEDMNSRGRSSSGRQRR